MTPDLTIERWKNRLQSALDVQRSHRADWCRWRDLYLYGGDRRRFYADLRSGNDVVRVNMCSNNVRSLLPRIVFKAPVVYTKPRRPGDEDSADVQAAILNYLQDELALLQQYRLAGLDALIFGLGWIKLGFDSEYGLDEDDVRARIEMTSQLEGLKSAIQQLRTFAGLPVAMPESAGRKKKPAERLEYNTNVIAERPWALRVSPWDVLVDPDAKSVDDAKWIAHRIVRTAEDAREDTSYTDERLKLTPEKYDGTGDGYNFWSDGDPVFPGNATLGAEGQENGTAIDSSTRRGILAEGEAAAAGNERAGLVSIYEVWDRKTSTIYTTCLQLSDYLREPELWWYKGDGFPFERLSFNDVPDRFYPKSDFQDWEPKQLELNRIRQYSLQWMKRMAKSVILTKKGVSRKFKEDLTGPLAFVVAELDQQGPLADSVMVLDLGRLPPDLYGIEEHLRRDLRDDAGIGSEQQGNATAGTTATAVNEASQANEVRVDEKRTAVEEFAARVNRKLMQICRQFWPQNVVMQIAGPGGAAEWQEIRPEDIKAEVDVKIEVGSASKPNDEVLRQQDSQFMQAILPLMLPGPMGPVLPRCYHSLVKKMLQDFGFADPEEVLAELEGANQMAGMPPGMPGAGLPGAGMEGGLAPDMGMGGGAPVEAMPEGPNPFQAQVRGQSQVPVMGGA